MKFLETAVLSPLNNFGPIGFFSAAIVWLVMLYYGFSYSVSARTTGSIGYMTCLLISIIMVSGLVMMVATPLFDDHNSVLTAIYAAIALVTFVSIGGFIGVMAASCGFLFGALVRLLNHMSYR